MHSALLSALHMIGLSLILGSIFMRARYLRRPLDDAGLQRLFVADNFWGIAAGVMIVTGLTRALTHAEKGWDYYSASTAFWVKMNLFAAIFLLEIWPMSTLITWRIARKKGKPVDTARARTFAILSDVQTLLALCMVFAAALMARGR
jgi:putative membrane protein